MRVYFLPSSEASVLLSLLKIIQVLQEQQPGGLLGIVKLGCATGFFPKNVINISKSLFEHGHLISAALSQGSRASRSCETSCSTPKKHPSASNLL